MALPLSRATWLRLNSLDRIMGVYDRSAPYSWTVCRKASYGRASVDSGVVRPSLSARPGLGKVLNE